MHGSDLAPRFAAQRSAAERHPLRYGVPRELAEEADGTFRTPSDQKQS